MRLTVIWTLLWASVIWPGTNAANPEIRQILPRSQDTVHVSWPNGPSTSQKLGGNNWPSFGTGGGNQLHLRFSNGFVIFSAGDAITLRQSYNFATGTKLSLRGSDSAIVDSSGKFLCGEGGSVTLSISCESPSWTFLSSGSLKHDSTGSCLAPSGSSAFGREDVSDLVLSSDCAQWKCWEFWTDPLKPPGFKTGFKIAGAASSFSVAGSTNRFSLRVQNEDGAFEGFRESLSGPDGTLSNLVVVRSRDNKAFPHKISYVEHIAWGKNMFIRPDPDDDDWSAEWNAFFSTGDMFYFEYDTTGGDVCEPSTAKFTGYNSGGSFCRSTNSGLDDNLLDVGGVGSTLVRQLGATDHRSLKDVYANLPGAALSVTADLTCGSSAPTTYTLSSSSTQLGLVRAGHTVVQVTASGLQFIDSSGLGYCTTEDEPTNQNCAMSFGEGSNNPCPESHPSCIGFVSGSSWGKCRKECKDEFWVEVDVWADSVALNVKGTAVSVCTGTVNVQVDDESENSIASASGDIANLNVPLRFERRGSIFGSVDVTAASSVSVTSTVGTVLFQPSLGDFLVEVPTSTPKCSYSKCGEILYKIPVTLSNQDIMNSHPVRLTLSRKFPIREGSISRGGNTGAEITGLSIMLFDDSGQPSGIPVQISKNWHSGSNAAYWAGWDGSWWSGNVYVNLPPDTSISLSFALSYEKYGGVPGWSHAQLSIVGYSDRWLWEEAALGTGGENICFDPLGSHTRATITDVRVKLFDGSWKENVGGGDFSLLYFDETGRMIYPKSVESTIWSSGPCFSNSTITSVTDDEKVTSRVEVSGSRTNDFVRVFLKVRHEAIEDVSFSRLSFFQVAAETYNYNNLPEEYVVGSGSTVSDTIARTCTGVTSKASDKMYYEGGIYREEMTGDGPWFLSMVKNQADADVAYVDNAMVVGDRGLVVREFKAKIGGVELTRPSWSLLCDKIEFGTTASVNTMKKGDYWEAKMEFLVLPRQVDYGTAQENSDSASLDDLATMSEWQRVREQATRGSLKVTGGDGVVVESEYPIGLKGVLGQVRFSVSGGRSLGYVPIVIAGLQTAKRGSGVDLWKRDASDETGNWSQTSSQATLGESSNYYQANWDRESQTFELVFNVEMRDETGTEFNFGTDPGTWTTSPTATPTPNPTLSPTTRPSMSPTTRPSMSPTTRPSTSPTTRPSMSPTTTPPPTLEPTSNPTSAQSPQPTLSPITPRPSNVPTTPSPVIPSNPPSKSHLIKATLGFSVSKDEWDSSVRDAFKVSVSRSLGVGKEDVVILSVREAGLRRMTKA
eukprot:CAMPEP_0118668116 /NCGR_PEP_ID=MMETSP0785-20121206/20171_1 /TAXON_ID=91992 /ORGANISM="Bolidomonas pacifica, Strain CCMP 1866" /LENGTH=1288 /DNA_ID=CAMNT_0006562661 /DNA_START=833 /DNA_END=4697 /DNA_ORIENTATION=-